MSVESVLYTGCATSTGGRDGSAVTSGAGLDIRLSMPRELGGDGGPGTNPEELFALGYSACFLGALRYAAQQEGMEISKDANVTARIGIGRIVTGFNIEADLTVSIPGVTREKAIDLVQRAHLVCPYSNATRGNIDLRTTIV
ncbi:organic hydroperoxide resistance protein [Stenotrophomonas sp. YAU14A_MKIMI4_1]|uniref:organic hydroperoxide resistance protein n=1 Tax=Stenotrophomonas sp. YAU14A_MKIMI4_1 TaxID=2072408 RepID=UPI000D53CDDE|nr:organic hydroperoxide resistance protein [Stenotrophomonas sp. YAU14A_MKIMI4_1]AWH31256.1 organic hydroperoxide resistance protein [Stenotrophomonas sp. YAU14A_MKIMI4_1]